MCNRICLCTRPRLLIAAAIALSLACRHPPVESGSTESTSTSGGEPATGTESTDSDGSEGSSTGDDGEVDGNSSLDTWPLDVPDGGWTQTDTAGETEAGETEAGDAEESNATDDWGPEDPDGATDTTTTGGF